MKKIFIGNIHYAVDAVLTRVSNSCAIVAPSMDSVNVCRLPRSSFLAAFGRRWPARTPRPAKRRRNFACYATRQPET